MKRFYFHYNKPYSKRYKKHKWSVHYNDTCFIVDEIQCDRPCQSKLNKRQPVCVMRGFANNVLITRADEKEIAIII